LNIPPICQLHELFTAQLKRGSDLRKSGRALAASDRRTAFALYVLAIEETMEAYQTLLLDFGLITDGEYVKLHGPKRHQIRQQLAIGLVLVFQRAETLVGPPKPVKGHYAAMNQAKKAIVAIKKDTDFLNSALPHLPYWEQRKQACLYVDWDESSPTNPRITKEDLDEMSKVATIMIYLIRMMNSRSYRRRVIRHRDEFRNLVDEVIRETGLGSAVSNA